MNKSEETAIELINSAFRSLIEGKIPAEFINTDISSFENISPSITELFDTAKLSFSKIEESYDFINSLSHGELEKEPPSNNFLISPFKQLQSNLRHLTWQTQQIASGDYEQSVSFLGDFSVAFNMLIGSLKDKQKLEDRIIASEQKYRELNELKDNMFSIIAHDLKGPIGNYKLLADFLLELEDYSDTAQIKEYLSMLQKSSESVYNLLENLLNWARSQRNEVKLKPGFHKINEIIEENFSIFSIKAKNKNILLTSELKKPYIAFFDVQSINLVIRNLISNALKFTPRGGSITISCKQIPKFVQIDIADTGVGISKENLEKIFKAAYLFSTKGTENEEGSGLGLKLCKDFTERNKGKLYLESIEDKGTTFSITIPLCG